MAWKSLRRKDKKEGLEAADLISYPFNSDFCSVQKELVFTLFPNTTTMGIALYDNGHFF